MAKRFLKKYIPTPEQVKENPSLRFLSPLFARTYLWHLNRRSVARAFFIGIFVAFIPTPMQMAIAATIAVLFSANIPVSIALVWISNPITMPPLFYATYRFGAWMMGRQQQSFEFELSFEWLFHELGSMWQPLYLGSLTAGLIFALIAFISVRVLWRISVVQRWKNRHKPVEN